MIIYLGHVWPLETPSATKMEILNECTIIMLTYGLMMFTDFVPDPETRFAIGWSYMAISLGNILVHLILLFRASGKQVKNSCKRKLQKSNAPKHPGPSQAAKAQLEVVVEEVVEQESSESESESQSESQSRSEGSSSFESE